MNNVGAYRMTEPLAEYVCIHSRLQSDCLGCLHGQIHRLNAYITRLREMVDPKWLARHDTYWLGGNTPQSDREGRAMTKPELRAESVCPYCGCAANAPVTCTRPFHQPQQCAESTASWYDKENNFTPPFDDEDTGVTLSATNRLRLALAAEFMRCKVYRGGIDPALDDADTALGFLNRIGVLGLGDALVNGETWTGETWTYGKS